MDTDNQGKIGVAVVGTGFGQKVHIPGFQEHPRTEEPGIAGPLRHRRGRAENR